MSQHSLVSWALGPDSDSSSHLHLQLKLRRQIGYYMLQVTMTIELHTSSFSLLSQSPVPKNTEISQNLKHQVSGLHPTLYYGLLLISLFLDDKNRNKIRNSSQDLSSRWQSIIDKINQSNFISTSYYHMTYIHNTDLNTSSTAAMNTQSLTIIFLSL